MERDTSPSLAEQLAAAQDWWREAGVDCAFADEAQSWLETPPEKPADQPIPVPAAAKPVAPPAPPAIGGDPAAWPTGLAGFAEWWLTEPTLDTGIRARVPPRGNRGAKVLALVPQPEAEDRERLLSGEQGKLLASFLGRAGVDETQVYVAAALPRHIAMPDWRELRRGGLDRVLRHHIELVGPERVILFGQDVISLMGHNPAQKPAFLLDFNQQSASVQALAARSLDHMLKVPSARSRFWRDWQDWTDGKP